MKYCKTCDIHYETPLEHCMFCHGDLTDEDKEILTYNFRPVLKPKKPNFWLRLFIVLNLGSIFITVFLDYLSGLPLSWSLTVGTVNIFSIVISLMIFSHSIWSTKLSKLLITISIGLILIALTLRDISWALDYVFPFVILAQLLILTSIILIRHRKWLDLSTNLISMSLIGLIPGLLFLLKLNTVVWPSIACVSYAFMTLLGIFILPSKQSREEFKSRFHI